MSARYSLSRILIVAIACVGAFGSAAAEKKGAAKPAPTIKDLEKKEIQV